MASSKVRMNRKGWDQLVKQVVDSKLVPAAEAIAADCNQAAGITDGYRAGTEGELSLRVRDYRATVITATHEAIRDNARHDRLINNLSIGAL